MLIIDIETIRDDSNAILNYKKGSIQAPSNYKDPEKIAQYKAEQLLKLYEKASLSPLTGKIITVGMYNTKNKEPLEFLQTFDAEYQAEIHKCSSEAELLIKFWDIMENNADLIITYNGKAFDFPFIYARSLIQNVVPTIPCEYLTNKYYSNYHIDLYNMLGEGKLQEWAFLLGATNVLNSEGALVNKWYENGEYVEILQHCHADLLNTYLIAERIVKWRMK